MSPMNELRANDFVNGIMKLVDVYTDVAICTIDFLHTNAEKVIIAHNDAVYAFNRTVFEIPWRIR